MLKIGDFVKGYDYFGNSYVFKIIDENHANWIVKRIDKSDDNLFPPVYFVKDKNIDIPTDEEIASAIARRMQE